MTTSLVISQANTDGIAAQDMDLQLILRLNVVPKFLAACGYTSWRRVRHEANILAGSSAFQLPVNAGHIKKVFIGPAYTTEITYAGDLTQTMAAMDTTASGIPDKYFLISSTGGRIMQFNKTLSEDKTFRLVYDTGGIFGADVTTDVDLDEYIPTQFQWGLVDGLKAEIFRARYGAGDKRYRDAKDEWSEWVRLASESREMTPPRRAVYVR